MHGYGQLAQYFIRHFEAISKDHFIVAPEGLSRFYLDGAKGRVGASWMTKEKRIDEIEDQYGYLEQLAFQFCERSELQLNVLGFSQGTATASRWLSRTNMSVDKLILWGGTIAQESDTSALRKLSMNIPLSIAIGNDDEFISEENVAAIETQLKAQGLRYTLHRFQGGHTIDAKLLGTLVL